MQLPDGTNGPVRWICDIVRVLDALDEEKSKPRIETDGLGQKIYGILNDDTLIFKDDAVGPHHIFRMKYDVPTVICDEEMRLACKAAGLKGTSFQEVGRPPKWAKIPKEVEEEVKEVKGGSTFFPELRDRLLEFGDDLMTCPAIAARCARYRSSSACRGGSRSANECVAASA